MKYEAVAEQIQAGRLKIRGVNQDEVVDRVQDKANRVRKGEKVHRVNRRRYLLRHDPEDLY